MNNKLIAAALLALCTLGAHPALAHETEKPRHGGIVQVANDVNFELVVEAGGAALYLLDHGKPMPAKGITGKLTVLNGSEKSEAEVKAAEGNKLEARGIKIASGAKVVAVINNIEGKTATLRFSIK